MASLRRWKLSPHRRSNVIIARAVDSREGVTAAIASGAIIPKNHRILPLQTPTTLAEMSLSRLSISPARQDEKPLRALPKAANRFRSNRNSARALLKSPGKASASCAIQNEILCKRPRTSSSLPKLCVASLYATGCGSTAKSVAAAVARN